MVGPEIWLPLRQVACIVPPFQTFLDVGLHTFGDMGVQVAVARTAGVQIVACCSCDNPCYQRLVKEMIENLRDGKWIQAAVIVYDFVNIFGWNSCVNLVFSVHVGHFVEGSKCCS